MSLECIYIKPIRNYGKYTYCVINPAYRIVRIFNLKKVIVYEP